MGVNTLTIVESIFVSEMVYLIHCHSLERNGSEMVLCVFTLCNTHKNSPAIQLPTPFRLNNLTRMRGRVEANAFVFLPNYRLNTHTEEYNFEDKRNVCESKLSFLLSA